MKRLQKEGADLKMNNSSDGSPDDNKSGKVWSQGVRPKVKHHVCSKGSKSLQSSKNIPNGSQNEKYSSMQNGASCSSFLSSSSTSSSTSLSSSVNKYLGDFYDKNNLSDTPEKCSAKGRTLPADEDDLRNHDKKRKNGTFMDNENSSGNEGDEGLSGDDCCIYTYKGDQFADLPNSFFNVNMVVSEREQVLGENHREVDNRRELQLEENERSNPESSPEMDYLEMDFDPGPSVEQDSEEDFDGFERKPDDVSPVPELPNEKMLLDDCKDGEVNNVPEKMEMSQDGQDPQPGPSNENIFQCSPKKHSKVSDCNSNSFDRTKDFSGGCCESFCSVDASSPILSTSNLEAEDDKTLESEADVNLVMGQIFVGKRLEKKISLKEKNDSFILKSDDNKLDLKSPFDGIMLWSEQEAISKQVSLVSCEVSCSATAVINVMLVLKMRFSIEKIKERISSWLKSESASIPQYLVSRSCASVGQENLIRGIHQASHGALYAKFFKMYPKRDILLSRWLSYWMKKGAVPIVTSNVQRDTPPEDPTLDTRHHQMIFGVNSQGIYLTNPLECLQDEELWARLNSPSVLKIKRSEIVSRWSPKTNLKPLMFQRDDRWKKMNVLGQVVNVIRESPDPSAQGKFLTQHILIPVSSGITLVIPRDSPSYEELVFSSDLPIHKASNSE